MEILSPVKNLEAAKTVIGAGADAIYFASPSFGARTKAAIELGEAQAIIKYALENNVATYATFNTVIFDDELSNFFHEIDELYQVGLSAVIIQDFSFIKMIKDHYPDLDVHCSTQMHIHNSNACLYIKKEGSNRVVVPREMNYERIKKIKDETNIEIEAFVHGALCVSYSGQCYDSTLLDQKSANRGRCSQYCRMPQHTIHGPSGKVVSKGEYPLNLKDQNNLQNLNKFENAGVDSLKIEGRLKSLDYAYLTTYAYSQKLNAGVDVDLENVYNRTFTTGRINSINGQDIVNLHRPNNTGKRIGKVINVELNNAKSLKYYTNVITIQVENGVELNSLDNIRYVADETEDGQVIEQFKILTKNSVLVFSNAKAKIGDEVYRTQNNKILTNAINAKKITRKTNIELNLFLKNNTLFYAIANSKPVNTNIIFEKALNKPTTKEEIISKLKKTNNTPYTLDIIDFKYNDDMFCQISKINNLKKEIIAQLEQNKVSKYSNIVSLPPKTLKSINEENEFYIEVQNEEQYNIVKKHFTNSNVLIANLELAKAITQTSNDYYVTPSVLYDDEVDEVYEMCFKFDNIVASEIGILNKFKTEKNIISNYTFNTTNYISQQKLVDEGVRKTLLSIELNQDKLNNFGNEHSIVNIYGRLPVMIMDYCPINMKKTNTCGSCRLCRTNEYRLEDKLGRVFPLVYAGNNRISMLSRKPISLLGRQDELNEFGINSFHLKFTLETEQEIIEVLNCLNEKENNLSFEVNSGSYFKTTL